jgi:hypothetical protein
MRCSAASSHWTGEPGLRLELPLWVSARPLAALQPGCKGLIFYAAERCELRATQSAAPILIKNPLPLLTCATQPPQHVSLDQSRFRGGCSRKQARRRCLKRTYYDLYGYIE